MKDPNGAFSGVPLPDMVGGPVRGDATLCGVVGAAPVQGVGTCG